MAASAGGFDMTAESIATSADYNETATIGGTTATGFGGGATSIDEGTTATAFTMNRGRPLGVPSKAVSKSLALNQAYQDVLDTFLTRAECSLQAIRDRAREVEKSLAISENPTVRKQPKVPVLLYMPPYFRDGAGMCPPPNADTQKKAENGEFDPLVYPSKHWTNDDCARLLNAVQESALINRTQMWQSRLDLIQEKLASDDTDSRLKKGLEKELDLLKDEIAKERATFSVRRQDADLVDWMAVSTTAMNGSRTSQECRLKFMNELAPDWNQDKKWSDVEKRQLKDLVHAHERPEPEMDGSTKNRIPDWDLIALQLGTNRTAYQCFEKYQSELNEAIQRRDWTDEEDAKLHSIITQLQQGTYIPWEQVCYYMEGRTRQQCRCRWLRTLNPEVKHGPWTEDEDVLLLVGVRKFGPKDWVKVASIVPGRTDQQCRERFTMSVEMDAEVTIKPYTEAEDKILTEAVLNHQNAKSVWRFVRPYLPHRSLASLKSRWALLRANERPTRSMRVQPVPSDKESNNTITTNKPLTNGAASTSKEPDVQPTSAEDRDHDTPEGQEHDAPIEAVDESDEVQANLNEINTKYSQRIKIKQKHDGYIRRKQKLGTIVRYDQLMMADNDACDQFIQTLRSSGMLPAVTPQINSDTVDSNQQLNTDAQSPSVSRSRVSNNNASSRQRMKTMHKLCDQLEKSTDGQMPDDIQTLVNGYRNQIEGGALVKKRGRGRRGHRRRNPAAEDERKLQYKLQQAMQSAKAASVTSDLMDQLASAVYKADKRQEVETEIRTVNNVSVATSRAYENALLQDVSPLPLLPPCLGTLRAYDSMQRAVDQDKPMTRSRKRKSKDSDNGETSTSKSKKPHPPQQPSEGCVSDACQSEHYKLLQRRASALFAWPAIMSSTSPPSSSSKAKKLTQADVSQ